MRHVFGIVLLLVTVFAPNLQAQQYRNASVDNLITANNEPDGVVFEIITWEDNTWDWAAPLLQSLTEQLRAKYPGLDIALISHGNELFDLASKNADRSRAAMNTLQNLSDNNVDIYVCGDFAKYKHLGTGDFLPFVDVAPSGPAQLQDYIHLGFEHVMLDQTNVSD